MSRVNKGRVGEVATSVAALGKEKILKFDQTEPGYATLTSVSKSLDPPLLSLLAIGAGIVDYQLGVGGAERFWEALNETYESRSGKIGGTKHIRELLLRFLNEHKVNARLRNRKADRVNRLFDSGFSDWFLENYERGIAHPVEVWERVAGGLNNSMDMKTIVFSMKTFDLASLITQDEYLNFPEDISIPVDVQVQKVCASSGMVESGDNEEEICWDPENVAVREACRLLTAKVNEMIGLRLSVMRIDSILWQLGRLIDKHRPRSSSKKSIKNYLLGKVDLSERRAESLAHELTYALQSEDSDGIDRGDVGEGKVSEEYSTMDLR